MLVVDLHALQAVDVLHFVHDVTRQFLRPEQAQNVLWIGRAVHHRLALVHDLAFVDQDVLLFGHEFFPDFAVRVGDLQTDLALGFLAKGDGSGGFRQQAFVLGRTGFKQLGHTRQTAGDVAGFLAFNRDTGQHFAGAHVLAVTDLHQRADREANRHGVVGSGDLHLGTGRIDQLDLRTHDLGRATALGIDHHQGRQASHIVNLLGHGQAFFDVLEAGAAGKLGDDGSGQRIPVSKYDAGFDHLVGLDAEHRAIRHFVALAFAAVFVVDDDFAGAGNHHQLALGVGHVTHGGVEADAAVGLGFDAGGNGRTGCRATDVEGAHGQLRTGFANRLGSDHADGLAAVDHAAATQVTAIAMRADAETGLAGQRRADLDFVHTGDLEFLDQVFVQQSAGLRQDSAALGVQDFFGGATTQHAVAQGFDDLAAFDNRAHDVAGLRAAIELGHHQVLGHVHQTAGQVTRVGGFQRRVGQTFTRTVGGDEVLQHVQAFAEVGGNRRLDDGAVGLGHQTAHTRHLADLGSRAARTGVGHHVDGVERLLLHLIAVAVGDHLFGELGHHHLGHFVTRLAPDVDHLVVALTRGDQTGDILLLNLFHFLLRAADDLVLLLRHQHVVDANRDTGAGGEAEARLQQLVGKHHGLFQSAFTERDVDEFGDFLLLQGLVDVGKRQAFGQDFRQQSAPGGGVPQLGAGVEFSGLLVLGVLGQAHADAGVQLQLATVKGAAHFTGVGKDQALAFAVDPLTGGVVQAQHHVLRRHDRWLAAGGEQHVVGGQHQGAGFHLRFHRQRDVHGHLVAVKVGVESRAHQRVQLNGFAFDENGLECLDAQTVQRRRTVKHDGVLFNHLFQDVPHHRGAGFDFLLGGLDGGRNTHGLELGEDEGFEQLQRHQLGQAALVQLEGGAHGNHRAARIVNPLAQQVLAEAARLAFDHVGQGLQGALVGAGHGFAAAAVVQQGVNRLLQHALLVAGNDFRRFEFEQPAQTAVTVDHAAVQIVQIGCGKTSAIQRHERTQVRRQHRQHIEHHPLGLDARLLEGFQHFEALGVLLDLQLGACQVVAQLLDGAFDVDRLQQLFDALSAHLGLELVTVFLELGVEIVLGHDAVLLERCHAGIGHHIRFKVEHALDIAQRHVQHQTQTAGQRFQEPDVGAGRGQIDMAHALATHFGLRDFNAALLADHAAVLQALVLAAQAFVVLDRPEDLGAKQAVALGLEGAVVDGFGLLHFTERP